MVDPSSILTSAMVASASVFGAFTAVAFASSLFLNLHESKTSGAGADKNRSKSIASGMTEMMLVCGVACMISIAAIPFSSVNPDGASGLIAAVMVFGGGYLVLLMRSQLKRARSP